jgi:hypothetical protein
LHVGTQSNFKTGPFEKDSQIAKAWCHMAISFAQHRWYLANGDVMHDVSFAYTTNGRKTRNDALWIKLLKLPQASRIAEQKEQGGNLMIGCEDG